jgi:hypothetical protein
MGQAGSASLGARARTCPVRLLAEAGPNRSAGPDALVTLDDSGSRSAEGLPLTYRWRPTAGPPVDLRGADTPAPRFVAPALTAPAALDFELTVDDGARTATDAARVCLAHPGAGRSRRGRPGGRPGGGGPPRRHGEHLRPPHPRDLRVAADGGPGGDAPMRRPRAPSSPDEMGACPTPRGPFGEARRILLVCLG